MQRIDETDRKILNLLQQDARLEIKQIAGLVHKTSSPVHDRIKKLQSTGIIQRYVAIVDRTKLGRLMTVMIQVRLNTHNTLTHECFIQLMESREEVLMCLQVSGAYDYLLQVSIATPQDYEAFLSTVILPQESISQVESVLVLKEHKLRLTVNV